LTVWLSLTAAYKWTCWFCGLAGQPVASTEAASYNGRLPFWHGYSLAIFSGVVLFSKVNHIMYAVIKTGGKQYKVAAGDKIKVEQILADIGAEVTLDQVLAVGSGESIAVGAPLVAGATVSATVVSHGRGDKVRIFKMRRRKHYKKQQGHRQNYTELFVSKIASSLGTTEVAAPVATKADDLELIEGIGPKINEILAKAGITTFAQLAQTPVDTLKDLLKAAGSRFAAHDPSTWAEQSALAAAGKWDEFKALTDELVGGKRK
jgi:large subunit ribosomal protein L21